MTLSMQGKIAGYFPRGTDMDQALLRLSHKQKDTIYVQIWDNERYT
jgi:hypothetical protein